MEKTPKEWRADGDAYLKSHTFGSEPQVLTPLSPALVDANAKEIFERQAALDGITSAFGEVIKSNLTEPEPIAGVRVIPSALHNELIDLLTASGMKKRASGGYESKSPVPANCDADFRFQPEEELVGAKRMTRPLTPAEIEATRLAGEQAAERLEELVNEISALECHTL